MLDEILNYFTPYYAKTFTINHKSSLSVQSGVSNPAQLQQDGRPGDINQWSLVCRKFAETARRRRFKTIAIRCSEVGLLGLQENSHSLRFFLTKLCDAKKNVSLVSPALLVQKLSLMVYGLSSLDPEGFEIQLSEARRRTTEIRQEIRQRNHVPDYLRTRLAHSQDDEDIIEKMKERTEEQRRIIDGQLDEKLILKALEAFDNRLKQVRLMRVDDWIERRWESYSITRPNLTTENKQSRWEIACKHAAEVLGRAFLQSGSQPPQRLSGRALPPETCLSLTNILQTRASGFAMRLNTLELQFDNRVNLDGELLRLSPLFLQGFTLAVNVQGLHIGFGRPVSIPFESVFRNVYWPNLQYIGFGSWKLNSEDIIGFVRAHRRTLRSVRLRGVLLNDDSKWTDVLQVLRRELSLKWASLRGVGYTRLEVAGAVEILDEFDDDSDEEDQSETESEWSSNSDQIGSTAETQSTENETQVSHETHIEAAESIYSDYPGRHESEDGSEAGESEPPEAANDIAIDDRTMLSHIDQIPDSVPSCNCSGGFAWDDLRDDEGENPSKELWKSWQEWVRKHCPTHDPPTPSIY